jgi:hypothetical protein
VQNNLGDVHRGLQGGNPRSDQHASV